MTDPNDREGPSLEDEIFGMESAPDTTPPHSTPQAAPRRDRTRRDRTRRDWTRRDRTRRDWTRRDSPPRERPVRPRWPTGDGPGCRDIAVMIMGFGTFVLVDCVMMYAPFRMEDAPSLLPQLITLLLLAFGLGGMLVWHIRGAWRPFGIGLMLGWLFMTLVSAGFLTGLNP